MKQNSLGYFDQNAEKFLVFVKKLRSWPTKVWKKGQNGLFHQFTNCN